MAVQALPFSKSAVNRAGVTVREYMLLEDHEGIDFVHVVEGLELVRAFRAAHQLPLTKATMGVRSMVRTEQCEIEVSQRLKRFRTILDKLLRQPEMALARMQDIGGCRAVLNSVDEVYRVRHRIRRNGRERRMVDYIARPAKSGYRGVHVITEYDGRLIEVQLRTQVQHEWAVTVERLGGRIDQDLKSGYGPTEVLDLLRAISEAMALEEAGGIVDRTTHAELSRLRLAAAPLLQGGR